MVESIGHAWQFMSAARAFARNKPMVAYKAGRFAESGRPLLVTAERLRTLTPCTKQRWARAGIVRLFDVEEMFDCVELLSRHDHGKESNVR